MLTTRETQALGLIARGLNDRQVAMRLLVSLSTARKHRENLQRKLDLHKSTQLAIYYLERYPRRRDGPGVPPTLSQREREVIHLLALGHSDKQAARELGLSDLTVRKHRANLQDKFRVGSVCALLYAAVAGGALALPLQEPPRSVPPAADRQLTKRLDKRLGGCLVH